MDYTEDDTFLALTRIPYSKLRESAAIKLFEFDCEAVYYGDTFYIGTFDGISVGNAVAGTGWTINSVQTYINAGLSVQNAIIRRYKFIKRVVYTFLILAGVASIFYFVGASVSGILIAAQWSISVMILLNLVFDNYHRQPSIRAWRDNHPSSIKRKKPNAFFNRK